MVKSGTAILFCREHGFCYNHYKREFVILRETDKKLLSSKLMVYHKINSTP